MKPNLEEGLTFAFLLGVGLVLIYTGFTILVFGKACAITENSLLTFIEFAGIGIAGVVLGIRKW